MVTAIIYVSNTGHTEEYANLIGEKTDIPVYELGAAFKKIPKGSEVLFLGWLMAGTVKGYKKAKKHFSIRVVCGVGMSSGDSQIKDIRKVNNISDDVHVFYLQGGFQMDKLHGVYKFMMKCMKSTVGKNLRKKENRTADENDMLKLLYDGVSYVSAENITEITDYIVD